MRKASIPGFIGKKLKEAKEARGLNGTSLAELVGVSRQSISKYEKGDQSPNPEVLQRLSDVLQVPINYFISPRMRSVDKTSPIFYRSMSAATLTERLRAQQRYVWLQDIVAYLFPLIEFPNVNLPDFDIPSDPYMITNQLIEQVAIELRKFWKIGMGPISNLTWLLENNGIIVGSYSLEAETLDAFSQFQYDRPYIIFGTDQHSAARSRFSLGHELGHLILHKNLSLNDIRTSKTFKLIEAQANRFSGAFHIPEKVFAEEFLLVNLEYFKLKKPKWKLSIAFFLERAKDLGLVSQDKYTLLRRYYSRNKWRTFEPYDDEIEVEKPQLLKQSMELLIENSVRTRSEIISKLRLNPKDVETLCGLQDGYLSPAEVVELPLKTRSKVVKELDGESADIIHLFERK